MFWESEPHPTTRERTIIELARRYERASRALGVGVIPRAVMRVLVVSPKIWTVSALAEETGFARATIRKTLTRGASIGNVEQLPDGWRATERGQGTLMRIHRETVAVVNGEQQGFTAELIEALRESSNLDPTKEAMEISFEKISYTLTSL